MYRAQVKEKCKELGINLSTGMIFYHGLKNGFIHKEEGKKRYTFTKEKFYEWVEKVKKKPSKGFISINELKEKNTHNMGYTLLYAISKRPEVEKENIGIKGVLYVNEAGFAKAVENYRNEHKEDL